MHATGGTPHAEHINEMLLSNVILLVNVALQSSEDVAFLHEVFPAFPFDLEQAFVGDPIGVCRDFSVFRRYRKVFQLFPKNDDGLF
jgi:hypothetical protein